MKKNNDKDIMKCILNNNKNRILGLVYTTKVNTVLRNVVG